MLTEDQHNRIKEYGYGIYTQPHMKDKLVNICNSLSNRIITEGMSDPITVVRYVFYNLLLTGDLETANNTLTTSDTTYQHMEDFLDEMRYGFKSRGDDVATSVEYYELLGVGVIPYTNSEYTRLVVGSVTSPIFMDGVIVSGI